MDLSSVQSRDEVTNLKEAFDLAEKHLNVPKLLDPEGEENSFLRTISENLQIEKSLAGFSACML